MQTSPKNLPSFLIAFALIVLLSTTSTSADVVTLVPMTGYPTGASYNALAGPLFSSDLDDIAVSGSGFGTATATKDGNTATHLNAVELDYSTTPAFFESDYSGAFSRTATLDHRASAESIFHFTVDTPAFYEAMGTFSVVDAVGTTVPGNVELEIELLAFDLADPFGAPPEVVLYSYQVSKSTIDAGFTVGGSDGDDTNVFDGSLTGLLDTDKLYRYRTLVTTNAIDIDGSDPALPTDGGATASGVHTLVIAPAAGIPEPGSCIILSAIGLALLKRRRKI